MEDDWIFLGDGTGSGSDSDIASASASDDDSGFTIVRRGRKGGDQCSVIVSDDAPAPPRVAAVAVPQPMPPGLSFKVVSYGEAFSASASSSDDGGGREQPAGEAIIQGAGIDDAAGTGSTDDCTVTCKEGCESGQVGEHDGTGSYVEAPEVAVAAAPTVSCPETTAVLHGEAHSELASGVDKGAAEEVEDDDSESCEDDDSDTENSSEDDDDDTDSSSDEDTDTSSEDDTDSSSEDEDEDMFSSSDEEDEDTFSSSDEEEDTFSSSGEEYTESFSEEYTAEIYSEEEDDDDDAESSGEEEEEDGSESCVEVDYVESSAEESHDADNTGEEDDDDVEVSGEEQEEDDDAECSGEVDDVESTGEEEGNDDSEISGEEGEGDAECSGDEPDDTVSSGEDSDDDAESSVEEEEEEEEEDTVSSGEKEESSHVVDVGENGKKDVFAMLFPRATTACEASAEQAAANANGAVKERSESFPTKYDDIDTDSSGSDMDTDSSDMEDDDCSESDEEDNIVDVAQNGNQAIFDMLFPKAKACGANMEEDESEHGYIDYEAEEEHEDEDMDTDSSDMEDDDCLESDEEDDIVDIAENQDIFAMLFPKAKACGANIDDYEDESEHGNIDDYEEEEDGSLLDMLLPRDHAIDDDIDTDSSGMEDNCLESDEEDDIVDVAENGNQDIFAMLRATACHANIDDYEDESEHGSIDDDEEEEEEEEEEELEDGEDEAATATAACGYSAERSHGTRRPEFAGRAARGYGDVDTDSDMEEGDDEFVAADVNGTSHYGWPRATTTGGGVESQHWGFASQSQTERLWEDLRRVVEDLRRQLAAEALESSGQEQQQQQQRSYDDVDDSCDLPGTAAAGGGPAGSCARTPEAQFTVRAERDTERELAMEEVGRREAAQRELDCALATEAAAAAEALESALEGCATAERQATGDVTRPAVAEPAVPADITFIIGVYVFVFLVVSLLSSLGLS